MDLRQNLSKSATNSIKVVFPDIGYPLKIYPLKKWIYENNHTQSYIARYLGYAPEEFKRKLKEKEIFYEFDIRRLVYLMGARNAFNVIYFPTKGIRQKVWDEVFGRYEEQEEKLNE